MLIDILFERINLEPIELPLLPENVGYVRALMGYEIFTPVKY